MARCKNIKSYESESDSILTTIYELAKEHLNKNEKIFKGQMVPAWKNIESYVLNKCRQDMVYEIKKTEDETSSLLLKVNDISKKISVHKKNIKKNKEWPHREFRHRIQGSAGGHTCPVRRDKISFYERKKQT